MRANQTLSFFDNYIKKLPHLTPREKQILTKRLGKYTLQKIGNDNKVTAERIRQIEKEALKRLKDPYQQRLFE